MYYANFLNWLLNERKLSQRGAKDVVSRCKRICNMLGIENIDIATIDKLNRNTDFLKNSMFIKSQLRRALTLWIEFKGGSSNA